MLRVAMITDFPENEGVVDGGVQAVSKYLVRAMAEIGDIHLDVISFRYGATGAEKIEADGYTLHFLPGARFGAVTGYWQDQRTFDRYLKVLSPDIVHSQGVGHDGTLAARSGYPVVTTIHGIFGEESTHIESFQRRMRHRLLDALSEYHCIRRAKHTILISRYVGDYWGDRLSGKKYMIANPVAPGFFDIDRREENGRILFAGRLYKLKGVVDLVRATAAASGTGKIKLVLAGSLDDVEYVDLLKAEAERLQITDQVEFAGILNEERLLDELSRAAVLVLPSYQENAPMVIQEAMAGGVPVISSRVGGTKYQIEDGESGFLFEAGDVSALTDRLTALFSDDDLRQTIGRSARQRSSDEFRALNVARATIKVYESILSEG